MINILASILVSLLISFGVYNYTPISFFDSPKNETFGSAITTINGSDTLSSSRTTINNNFTSLNNGKIEVGTTSVNSITTLNNLATVGTITSGIWNGTAIDVARQGTGTTSPTSNQVIIGNGASGFKVIGFGTSGQFLTSGGNGSAPSWTTSTNDPSADYNWTGTNLFKNLNASSTVANPIVLNGVSFNTPSSQGLNNQGLVNDGSGNLTWKTVISQQYSYATTSQAIYRGTATHQSRGLIIPASTLTSSSTITVSANISCIEGGFTPTSCDVYLSDTDGNNYIQFNIDPAVSQSSYASFTMNVFSNNSTSAQVGSVSGIQIINSVPSNLYNSNSTSISWSGSKQFVLRISNVNGTGNSASIDSYSIIVQP